MAAPARVPGGAAQFLFDAEQLIVFGDPIGPARRSGFDLTGRCPDSQVRDGRVLGFSGPVRDDRAVVGVARHLHGVQRFGHRADLIELDQQCVADADLRSRASEMSGLVTNTSSPTSCTLAPSSRVSICHPAQSLSATPSSIEMIG